MIKYVFKYKEKFLVLKYVSILSNDFQASDLIKNLLTFIRSISEKNKSAYYKSNSASLVS